eukprot:COSAG01_NODE_2904_length_6887_cov_2.857543_4_plen_97_part_00
MIDSAEWMACEGEEPRRALRSQQHSGVDSSATGSKSRLVRNATSTLNTSNGNINNRQACQGSTESSLPEQSTPLTTTSVLKKAKVTVMFNVCVKLC